MTFDELRDAIEWEVARVVSVEGDSQVVARVDVDKVAYEYVRDGLRAHKRDVVKLQRGAPIDWGTFLALRSELWKRNDVVITIMAMRETPVRKEIDAALRERKL